MKKLILLLVVLIAAMAFIRREKVPAARDPRWAQPIEIEGVPNLHKISDALYRGAQPTAEGVKELKKLGIKTIVNLRAFHSDKDELGNTELDCEEISFKAWHPEKEDVVKFLKIVTDKTRQPVFFHCEHGADRTGMMCAIYRIIVQVWTKEDAIEEMKDGGYGFHSIWINLPKYIKGLDVDDIKKAIVD